MARKFTGLLFHGMGNHSFAKSVALHLCLGKGLSLSSVIQQPSRPENDRQAKEDEEMITECKQEIEEVVRDIAAALLGREIEFGGTLPYPPEGEDEGMFRKVTDKIVLLEEEKVRVELGDVISAFEEDSRRSGYVLNRHLEDEGIL